MHSPASTTRHRFRLGLLLWGMGMLGIVSLLLAPFPPLPEGIELPLPVFVAKLLNLIFPTLLLTASVTVGVVLAPRVRLGAPLVEAGLRGRAVRPVFWRQLPAGVVGGLVGAGVLAAAAATSHVLPAELLDARADSTPPLLTAVLYGGITEELLLRWGMMTFFVWLPWRVVQGGRGRPHPAIVIAAIVLSALLFGAGHLPAVVAYGATLSTTVVVYIVGFNALFGLVAGVLYWHRGLEAAICAHALAHVFAWLGRLGGLG